MTAADIAAPRACPKSKVLWGLLFTKTFSIATQLG
jgi:hypothetical protein|tara:strand:- start:227 stop:331 length:105 start_codon:yes stop_codon:yes gene_type:complete